MTWSYSGDPANSTLDEYRFHIGDTDANEPLLQDAEVKFILDKYSEVNTRLYHLYQRVADKLARDIKKSLGPASEDPTSRLEYYTERANFYRARCASAGLSTPTYAGPKIFRKGMHDSV